MSAPPTPVTVNGTTVFSTALWNNGPAALDGWIGDPPRAVLLQTVAQSIPNNADTAVAFDQVIYDNYNARSTDGRTWTAPAAGVYLVTTTSNLAWAGASGAFVGNHLAVVGKSTWAATEIPAMPGPARFQFNVGALIPLALGDGLQLRIYQNSGATQPTGFVGCGSRMSVRWIAL